LSFADLEPLSAKLALVKSNNTQKLAPSKNSILSYQYHFGGGPAAWMAAQMVVALASKVQVATWSTAAVVSLVVVAVAAAIVLLPPVPIAASVAIVLLPPVPIAASVVVVSIAVASLAIAVASVVVAARTAFAAVVAVAAPSTSSVEFAATGRVAALEAEEILLMDLAAAGH